MGATANVGDTQILLITTVNWIPGDKIVIASSSFFAEDVDEASVTQVTVNANGSTMLSLDTPLLFTHLGVMMHVSGDPGNHTLDLRAEVGVLTRNVVFEVSLEPQEQWQLHLHLPLAFY